MQVVFGFIEAHIEVAWLFSLAFFLMLKHEAAH
jgi:hypothetical protein